MLSKTDKSLDIYISLRLCTEDRRQVASQTYIATRAGHSAVHLKGQVKNIPWNIACYDRQQ